MEGQSDASRVRVLVKRATQGCVGAMESDRSKSLISKSEGSMFLMFLQGERGEGGGKDHIRGTTQEEEEWRKDHLIGKHFLLGPEVF